MNTAGRYRKIHLDFHNSPLIDDLGADFDADEFADTLARANVNYVVCFAKCHHGMCYYNARHGQRHPALTFDLLGAQIEACHRRDIAVSAYLSVVWEEEAARLHPEWQQLGPDGTPRHTVPGNRWATVCLNSPYIEEVLIPQTEEVCRAYDVDGMWFDMIHLDENACYCEWCRRRMAAAGRSYSSERDCFEHTADTVYGFLDRCSSAIRAIRPGVDIEYNSQVRLNARRALPHITGFEIECTPSERGYLYFTLFARHARTTGHLTRGVSPAFFRFWADFGSLKNEQQLRWETATMLANGSMCSLGDQMHPRSRLEPAVYERIGRVFGEVARREEWCRGAAPMAEIAVLADDDRTDYGIAKAADSVWGAMRMLVETHAQFDIVDRLADFTRYALLILPDNRDIDAALAARIQAFLDGGGRVLASGTSSLAPAGGDFLLPGLGATYEGPTPCSANYIRMRPEAGPCAAPDMPLVVRYPCVRIRARPGAEVLADLVPPYFERTPEHFTSHHQSPWTRAAGSPAIIRHGRAIYVAAPIFDAYHRDADTHYRLIFESCLNRLLPRRIAHVDGMPMLEVSVHRQGARTVVHLVNYAANKRGRAPETIEAIPTLRDIPLRLRSDAPPASVRVAPSGEAVPFQHTDGYVSITVPTVDIHQIVVIE